MTVRSGLIVTVAVPDIGDATGGTSLAPDNVSVCVFDSPSAPSTCRPPTPSPPPPPPLRRSVCVCPDSRSLHSSVEMDLVWPLPKQASCGGVSCNIPHCGASGVRPKRDNPTPGFDATGRAGSGIARRPTAVYKRPAHWQQLQIVGGDFGRTCCSRASRRRAAVDRDGSPRGAAGRRGADRAQSHRHLPHRRIHPFRRRPRGPVSGDPRP